MSESQSAKGALRFVRADFDKLDDYKPVKPLDSLAAELGVAVSDLVKLDANENIYGTPAEVSAALAEAVLHVYPDPGAVKLCEAIAEYLGHGVTSSQVVAGAGSDDLLDILVRVTDPDAIIISSPTFGMYSFFAKLQRSKLIDVPRQESEQFSLNVGKLCEVIRSQERPPLVFVASPNNPTGDLLTQEEAKVILETGCLLVVDEAYAEFAKDSCVGLLNAYPNLVVLRTFSKWAGLAGLRIGYGVADVELSKRMMAIKQPYNVNVAADVAARAALAHRDSILQTCDAMVEERDSMSEKFGALGWLEPLPSRSNFVLFKVTQGRSAVSVALKLRARGILIRYWSKPTLKNYIRVSAGRPEHTELVLATLKELDAERAFHERPSLTQLMKLRSPQVFLFDMDGVLVDVGDSYRASIVKTAEAFGVPDVTAEEIHECKAEGGCNNDWILTQTLLKKRGVDKPLDEVTRVFEDIYQGTDDTPGLRLTERIIVDKDMLTKLKAKMPLGVVTGRPRSDALNFLRLHDIEHLFDALVCMNEAPAKPDPAPVHLALQRMSASSAVLIGDTPDDVRAAVSAGALALGVLAPGSGEAMETALYDAGADLVLRKTDDLAELLA